MDYKVHARKGFFFSCVFHSWKGAPWVRDSGAVLFFVEWWSQWCLNMLLWLHLPRNSRWPSGMQWPPPCHLAVPSSRWFNPAQADGKKLMSVVGREPKCPTLWETVCSFPGAPGRSQEVWSPFAISTLVPPWLQLHEWSSSTRKGKDRSGKSSASFFRRSSPLVHCQLDIDLKSRMTGQYTLT